MGGYYYHFTQFSDAYEYYYADHRGEGVEYVSEYCDEKVHLKIPKQVVQELFV